MEGLDQHREAKKGLFEDEKMKQISEITGGSN